MICNMKPCNITYMSLIIAQLSQSNKTTAQMQCAISCICVYYFIVLSCCLHSVILYFMSIFSLLVFVSESANITVHFCYCIFKTNKRVRTQSGRKHYIYRTRSIFNKQFMALRAIWQFMDRDVTHKILYGPKRS